MRESLTKYYIYSPCMVPPQTLEGGFHFSWFSRVWQDTQREELKLVIVPGKLESIQHGAYFYCMGFRNIR